MRILWIPFAAWHVPQRCHAFCRYLAERHEVHVTHWDGDFARPADYLSRRYLANFRYRRLRDGRITVHQVPRLSPALPWRRLRAFNRRLMAQHTQRLVDQLGIDAVVGSFVAPPPRAPRLVFDLQDDNVTGWRLAGYHAYADEIAAIEAMYLAQAHAIVTASTVLADCASAWNRQGSEERGAPVVYIPNAIDVPAFRQADGAPFRAQMQAGDRRLAGMVGNHQHWGEIDKVLSAAEGLRDEEVLFLIAGRGPMLSRARQEARRQGLMNVRFMGYIPPEQVAALMAALDVGLCPYASTPMDDARCPMRLIMYLAAGCTAVCTRLQEVERWGFEQVVLVEDSPEAFAAGVRQALTMPKARAADLERFDIASLGPQYESLLLGATNRRGPEVTARP